MTAQPMPVFTENLFTPEPWFQDAMCAQTDPEIFFPVKGGTPMPAKSVCVSCDVQAECLAYALRTGQTDGIWGGLTPRERAAMRRAAGRKCRTCDADLTGTPLSQRWCGPCGEARRAERRAGYGRTA